MVDSPVTVDLRSDTVTRPTEAMRAVIAAAKVGDDVLGDDPTVNRLQERVARMFGKPAALFVPSGTMANQLAVRAHTEPGDEIILHRDSHVYNYEGGAACALSGCSLRLLDGARGMFSGDDVRRVVRADDPHHPHSRLIVIENTQNRGGGSIWPVERVSELAGVARETGLKLHCDGARIMNACVGAKISPDAYGRIVDSITICFSKGLGAPIGSALIGDEKFIYRARRFRKMFGGAMRQAGLIAAAAEYALDHNVERLADDHARARRLAEGVADCGGISVIAPETNIVYFDVDPDWGTAKAFVAKLREEGVAILADAAQQVRAVTHLHITDQDIDATITAFRKVAGAA